MMKKVRKIALILMCSVLAGTLLLVLVFLLPVDSARRHAEESLYEMAEIMEDPEGSAVRKAIVGIKENFTDFLMVQNALEKVEGRGVLEHALNAFHHDLQDDTTWMTEKSLAAFLRHGSEGMYLKNYAKYWHGYLIYLKPLLMCMSWGHVEIVLIVFQIILLAVAVAAAFRKRAACLGVGVVVSFLFMKPLRIWFSLAMSVCWMITAAAVALLFVFYDRIREKGRQEEFFLVIGIMTAYFDFLTYPIVTLGLPLSIWLVHSMGSGGRWWKKLVGFLGNCVFWVTGYVGMWGMKWVVTDFFCHTGTLREAAWSIIYRTSPLDGYSSFFSGVSRTWAAVLLQYDSILYGVGFGVIAAAALISGVWCLVKARNAEWAVTEMCLAVTGLLPIGWLILTQNHTAIHCEFTFRIMGVSVMALWCMTISSVLTLRRRAGKDEISERKH